MAERSSNSFDVKSCDENCFFKKIDHAEASCILLSEGGYEGLWLVRESTSNPDNYVISIIMDGCAQHILVHQLYKDDAVYSLAIAEDTPVFHGLDMLIKHYKSHPLKPSLSESPLTGSPKTVPYTLKKCCKGSPLPDSCKLHGTDNALHLAVQKDDVLAVQNLLKSGYRQVDARNKKGQTAIHIACLNGNELIIEELLKANAKLKVIDSNGLSPMHYLCRINKASLLKLLLIHDPSAIQFRVPSSGEVALHEAAASRTVACAEMLLLHGAPRRPRNSAGQTPEDLAKLHNANNVVHFLQNYQPITPRFTKESFLHGALSRLSCQQLLQQVAGPPFLALGSDLKDGVVQNDSKLNAASDDVNIKADQDSRVSSVTGGVERTYFLVRASVKTSKYVLSLRHASQTLHFEILQNENQEFYIDSGPLFSCLESLVDHYTRFEDGLPALLTHPVSPCNSSVEADAGTVSSMDSRQWASSGTRRLLTSEWGELTRDADASREDLSSSDLPDRQHADSMSKTFEQLCLDGSLSSARRSSTEVTTLQGNKTSEVCGRIDPASLSLGRTLGAGEFGSVLNGVWISPAGDQRDSNPGLSARKQIRSPVDQAGGAMSSEDIEAILFDDELEGEVDSTNESNDGNNVDNTAWNDFNESDSEENPPCPKRSRNLDWKPLENNEGRARDLKDFDGKN
ncbi:Ankyrin repeat-containing domain [Trinorchestia longiramus]|nr:Ankyrin repeat-containing domain [Trinorchestia longiramus]